MRFTGAVSDMTDSKKKRKRGKLPKNKPVKDLTDKEVMERLFSKKVVRELDKLAHDDDSEAVNDSQPKD
jgi:hypothetical protein